MPLPLAVSVTPTPDRVPLASVATPCASVSTTVAVSTTPGVASDTLSPVNGLTAVASSVAIVVTLAAVAGWPLRESTGCAAVAVSPSTIGAASEPVAPCASVTDRPRVVAMLVPGTAWCAVGVKVSPCSAVARLDAPSTASV